MLLWKHFSRNISKICHLRSLLYADSLKIHQNNNYFDEQSHLAFKIIFLIFRQKIINGVSELTVIFLSLKFYFVISALISSFNFHQKFLFNLLFFLFFFSIEKIPNIRKQYINSITRRSNKMNKNSLFSLIQDVAYEERTG